MIREVIPMKSQVEIQAIIDGLKELYPDAECSLDYRNDYELLFAVRLAAQCTDARVNLVTPALFERYPTLEAFAEADVDEVGQYVHSTGFWRAKARDMVASAQMLLTKFDGKVPDNMEDLLSLPGVGRKTANVIQSVVFNKAAMAVDTHVFRVSHRIGLVTKSCTTPLAVEKQLMKHIPEEIVPKAHHWLILHGRYVCIARKPKCEQCGLNGICAYSMKPTNL